MEDTGGVGNTGKHKGEMGMALAVTVLVKNKIQPWQPPFPAEVYNK